MKKDKFVIEGDERNIKPIRDNADVVCYLKTNGVDDKGEEIPSSAYLSESNEFFARCRFPYVKRYIEEFSAENLEKAVVEGIKKQNKLDNCDGVTFDEQQKIYAKDEETFEEVIDRIKELYDEMEEKDIASAYGEIVEQHLGDTVVSEATEKQMEALRCIMDDLQEKLDSI